MTGKARRLSRAAIAALRTIVERDDPCAVRDLDRDAVMELDAERLVRAEVRPYSTGSSRMARQHAADMRTRWGPEPLRTVHLLPAGHARLEAIDRGLARWRERRSG